MSFSFKKTVAAAAAVLCTAAMCGCVDSGSVGTIDGYEIKNGVYLYYLVDACSKANTEISEVKQEEGDTSEVTNLFAETVDGKDAKVWVKDNAYENLRKFVAVERLFEERGLTLPEDKVDAINSTIKSLWNDEDMYSQYIFGTDTRGEYYDSIGIGEESMKIIETNYAKDNELFLSYYDEGGEKALSRDEINTYLKDNFASVKYVEVPFEDERGVSLKDEAEIQAVKDKAQSYVDRVKNGESLVEIRYEVDLLAAQNEAKVEAEDAAASESTDGSVSVEDAVNAVTVEKVEESALVTVISKESSSLDEALTEYIWSMADDGTVNLFSTEDAAYVIIREDITANEEWYNTNKSDILNEMKGDEFDQFLIETGNGYTISFDSYLVDTKYAPDKIRGVN